MTESEFNALVEKTLESLQEALDDSEADLDYEDSGGVMTVTFANDTSMVFSRQVGSFQLWLAARAGGFHFEYDTAASDWRGTRDAQLLRPFVEQLMAEQADVELKWS